MAASKGARSRSRSSRFGDSVFYNCPFDREYWPLFEAIVFCIVDCGFVPRSALEEIDSGEPRVHKIWELIRASKYAIHDLSRVELGKSNGLPRFNMPFEFGLDIGARHFGEGRLKTKCCLVLEAQDYTYQKTLSDVAGQDAASHHNSPDEAITAVRGWLRTASKRTTIPGELDIKKRFAEFSTQVPAIAAAAGLDRLKLTFVDYVHMVEVWLGARAA